MTVTGEVPGAAEGGGHPGGGPGPAPCERCGEARIDFDERYRPVCRSCGASRVRPADPARDALAAGAIDPNLILRRPTPEGWSGKSPGVKVAILVACAFVAAMIAWTAYGLAAATAGSGSLAPTRSPATTGATRW